MSAQRTSILVVIVLCLLPGCRSVSRDISRAIPGWLNNDPGEKERAALGEILQSREWTEADLADQETRYEEIIGHIDGKRWEDADDAIDEYLELYTNSSRDEELRYRKGLVLEEDENYEACYDAFRKFSEIYVVSRYYPEITELLYTIGKEFIQGEHPSFLGMFSNRDEGEKILNFVVETFPTGRRAADSQWLVAEHHRSDERWRRGAAAYEFLAKNWPGSPLKNDALYWRAVCLHQMVKGVRYDNEIMTTAQEAYDTYLRASGDDDHGERARVARDELEELRARSILRVGEWYLGRGKAYTARFYLMQVRVLHGRTKAAQRATQLLEETLPAGEESIVEKPEAAPKAEEATPPGETKK